MGEAKRNRTATAALVAKYPRCCLCGGIRDSTTRDHVPPKALFDNSHRPNELVVPACSECNGGSSTSDLVASIVSRWRYANTDVELNDHNRLVRQLRQDAPDVIAEWTKANSLERMVARRHLESHGVYVPPNAGFATIGEKTIPHLTLFAHKLTLALFFEKMGAILPNSGALTAYWRNKEDFQAGALPKELMAMLAKHDFLKQGKWDERRAFEYRYETNAQDGLFACLARCRVGLFVMGLAVKDRSLLGDLDDDTWLAPEQVLSILNEPRFKKRHQ